MTLFNPFTSAEEKLTFFSKGPSTDKSKTYQERKGVLKRNYIRKAKSSHAFIGEEIVLNAKTF